MKYNQLVKGIDAASRELLGHAAVVVNQSLVLRNWLIGAYIVEFEQHGEDRAKYGERLYFRLAADLRKKQINGCGERMLQQMAVFYRAYPQLGPAIPQPVVAELQLAHLLKQKPNSATSGCGIGQTLVAEFSGLLPARISAPVARQSEAHPITPLSAQAVLHLSWTHLLELIRLDDPLKRAFYENECLKGHWSKRKLQRKIGSLLYERTGLSRNKAAVLKRAQGQEPRETIADLIRDPYILEFTGLADRPEYHESDLEKALLNHLQSFLLELGTGFLFEARQRRITVGTEHDYIDLVFFHRHLRCHVLLDLKVRPFRHGDAGQMNFYLNWWQANVTAGDEQPPVGILLCTDKDETKVAFATAGMDNRLFVSRYLNVLPSEDQLRRFVDADRARLEATMAPPARPAVNPVSVKGNHNKRKVRPAARQARRKEGRRK